MIVGSIAFGFMGAGIKFAGGSGLHAFEVAFFRSLFGLIALSPFLFGGGVVAVLATRQPRMHILRALFGSATMLCTFYAITHMELAAATALIYARPLFLIVLAVFFLGEAVRWRRWLATACGFGGVMMILRPDVGAMNAAAWSALAAAFLMACVITIIKRMSSTERPLTMLAWFSIASCFVTGRRCRAGVGARRTGSNWSCWPRWAWSALSGSIACCAPIVWPRRPSWCPSTTSRSPLPGRWAFSCSPNGPHG